ncbi:MAG: hypothetical protein M3O95_01975 [Candidatus Dormibacteraeota bacterium]|nr:hypothetical protein [Candidatus Dormibacteraeota bacterium]
MSRSGQVAYHSLALLAMLAHLVVVGPWTLVVLASSSPPGTGLATLLLKLLVFSTWCGLSVIGIAAWSDRSWRVVAVPIVSFGLASILHEVGKSALGWSIFSSGY